jgi:epoxyqueuosine reductase
VIASALRQGFVSAGVAPSDRPSTYAAYQAWLRSGFHGEMAWLERDEVPRRSPESVLPYCKSILSVGLSIKGRGEGSIARYARGEDYHLEVRRLLRAVVDEVRSAFPAGTHFRVCVDTAPLLEREIAARAGLGFIGKNGLLIVPGAGSHVVLGELLTDALLLPTSAPLDGIADRCGACTACLAGCPTSAFVAPRVLDARRCLSYLTIEKRGAFTAEEESCLDGKLFGCDVCQDVCPFNAVLHPPGEAPDDQASLDPRELVGLDQESFESRFGKSAIWRATAEGLARNARAALERECRA